MEEMTESAVVATPPETATPQAENGAKAGTEREAFDAIYDQYAAERDGGEGNYSKNSNSSNPPEERLAPKTEGAADTPEKPVDAPKIAAPKSWNKTEREAWDAAPQDVKNALIRRAEQVEAWGKKIGQDYKAATAFGEAMRPMGEAIASMRPYLESMRTKDGRELWGNPDAIANEFRELASFKAGFLQNPTQGLREIIRIGREHGLNMETALAEVIRDAAQWEDAALVQQRAEAERQRARAEALEAERRQDAMREQAQAHVRALGEHINALAGETDAAGAVKYPHLYGDYAQEVGELMGRYLRANINAGTGITPDIFAEAYAAAVHRHPGAREAEARKTAYGREVVSGAKRAAGIVPQGAGGHDGPQDVTPEEAFDAVWKRYRG